MALRLWCCASVRPRNSATQDNAPGCGAVAPTRAPPPCATARRIGSRPRFAGSRMWRSGEKRVQGRLHCYSFLLREARRTSRYRGQPAHRAPLRSPWAPFFFCKLWLYRYQASRYITLPTRCWGNGQKDGYPMWSSFGLSLCWCSIAGTRRGSWGLSQCR
jgi:hypothetical protein